MYLYCIYVRLGIIDCLRIKFRKETPSAMIPPRDLHPFPKQRKLRNSKINL